MLCNDATVCGGRVRLKTFVRVWVNMCKSLEGYSAMMFSVLLVCCDYRDVLLLTRVQPSQRATASCDSEFTGSKDALCV